LQRWRKVTRSTSIQVEYSTAWSITSDRKCRSARRKTSESSTMFCWRASQTRLRRSEVSAKWGKTWAKTAPLRCCWTWNQSRTIHCHYCIIRAASIQTARAPSSQ
jgi:hypothetical protein